jgi:tRNA nucleotidyltransferase (CCA-adding enzyme)
LKIPKALEQISKEIEDVGGRALLVGGGVRDFFLGFESKDFDLEVYGLKSIEELENILSNFGKVASVGKSFGVLKLKIDDMEYDFALPRVETKIAKGHRGFEVVSDGFLDYKSAAKRRDFTMNSIGYDLIESKILDPFDGRSHIDSKILRHIDDKSFVEDPLRVYRGIQFCARFDLAMDPKTKALCKEMVDQGALEELAKERIFEEFKKLLLKAKRPSIGFELMRELGVLRYFPQLEALIGVEQDPIWHPEGDVWIHTMMVIDEMANLKKGSEKEELILMFGALCHDFGKPSTTSVEDGRVRSKGHEAAGVEPTREFLQSLCDDKELIDEVLPIVANHIAPFQLYEARSSDKAIRRLSTRVNIQKLLPVAMADFLGRDTKDAHSRRSPAIEWLEAKAKELEVQNEAPKPLIKGRDLINLGLKPSPKFKEILDDLYNRQLDGEFDTKKEGIRYLKRLI